MITEGKSWKSPLFKSRRMKEIEGPKVEISTVEINAVVFIALVHLLCSRTFYTGTSIKTSLKILLRLNTYGGVSYVTFTK